MTVVKTMRQDTRGVRVPLMFSLVICIFLAGCNKGVDYYNRALEFQASGKPKLAVQNYKLALQANPQLAEACINMSKLYIDQEEFSLAKEYAQKGIDLLDKRKRRAVDGTTWEKTCSMAYQNLGSAETMVAVENEDMAGLERGIDHLKKAVSLDPENAEAKNLLAKLEDAVKDGQGDESGSESPQVAACRQALYDAVQKLDASEQAMDQAKAVLARYTAVFNEAATAPNPLYAQASCTTLEQYTSGIACTLETREIINSALRAQAEKTTPYRQYAEYHAKQAESEKKWNHATEYQQQVAKYWQARHNLDYFSTYAYLDTLVKEQLLDIATREAAARLHELDVATYGYLTPDKTDRISKGMSLAQVEYILGPGAALGSYEDDDLKLDKYQWTSKDGKGAMTGIFERKRLYLKKVQWY